MILNNDSDHSTMCSSYLPISLDSALPKIRARDSRVALGKKVHTDEISAVSLQLSEATKDISDMTPNSGGSGLFTYSQVAGLFDYTNTNEGEERKAQSLYDDGDDDLTASENVQIEESVDKVSHSIRKTVENLYADDSEGDDGEAEAGHVGFEESFYQRRLSNLYESDDDDDSSFDKQEESNEQAKASADSEKRHIGSFVKMIEEEYSDPESSTNDEEGFSRESQNLSLAGTNVPFSRSSVQDISTMSLESLQQKIISEKVMVQKAPVSSKEEPSPMEREPLSVSNSPTEGTSPRGKSQEASISKAAETAKDTIVRSCTNREKRASVQITSESIKVKSERSEKSKTKHAPEASFHNEARKHLSSSTVENTSTSTISETPSDSLPAPPSDGNDLEEKQKARAERLSRARERIRQKEQAAEAAKRQKDATDASEKSKARLQLSFQWWNRLGRPRRDDFKKRVKKMLTVKNDGFCEISLDDVESLPWTNDGTRIDITASLAI